MSKKPGPKVDHLIGKQVIAKTGDWTFVGVLGWTTDIDVPGCIDIVNPEGEIAIGGMPWTFDSIEAVPAHPDNERCHFCASNEEMENALTGRPHPTNHMQPIGSSCPNKEATR